MHTHTYLGQTLRHDHPGGDQPHGYFGHEEDKGGPAYGAGTYERLGKATAGSGGVARVEVTRTGARTERTRYYTLGLLPASERGRAVLVVQNNYTGHAESYALPNGMRLVAVGTEPEPGELCNACGQLLGPDALADALAGVDAVQNGPGGFGAGPEHELAALRDLAEAVRVRLLADQARRQS